MALPFFQRFVGVLGETKIGDARKALIDAVVTVRAEQLQSSQHAEGIEQAASHLVLAAFAARKRHEQRVRAKAAGFQREHAAVLVVGMRGGVHQARGGFQTLDRPTQSGCANVLRQGLVGRDFRGQDRLRGTTGANAGQT